MIMLMMSLLYPQPTLAKFIFYPSATTNCYAWRNPVQKGNFADAAMEAVARLEAWRNPVQKRIFADASMEAEVVARLEAEAVAVLEAEAVGWLESK
jgi:hypothetical protein